MTLALKPLDSRNLPTPKDERWKFTNLPRAMPQGLKHEESQPLVIRRERGKTGGEVHDILFTGRDGVQDTPRLEIIVEEGAELTLLERHAGAGTYWKNMVTEVTLHANAKLHHVRLQCDAPDAVHTNMVHVRLARDATYDSFTMNNGGKMVRHDIHALIEGPGAHCALNGLQFLDGARHGDTTILIEHIAPHCTSNQFYRSLVADQARGVFQGKVHVHRPAQKTDAYQLSNALLLSPKAEMDTKPELEIYADDVKCSHGTTTGQMDETPLFYLRSRGLDEAAARRLLLQAFVDEVVDKVGNEDLKAMLHERTAQWLQTVL